ncbi:MAG: hypothetical protein FJ146_02740 [Deltaproteobacteria bacterium]|nr:hypothetical protein [Deltaproteobacteria bacterium]
MASQSALEGDRIRSLVTKVDNGAMVDPGERQKALDLFERYECWGPYFRLLNTIITENPRQSESYFIRLAKVQNRYLEDAFAAAESCANMVADLKLGYLRFSEDILPQIIEFEDYIAESTILSAICDYFPTVIDRISCLERLCMLYEKKTHNENRLVATYEKLLLTDPSNVRALRYFKLTYTQSNEWDQVVDILLKLLQAVRQPQEIFRVGQELAAIYLYQMDRPNDALLILDSHCADSPLDTSNIAFDAYQRLADWDGCLKVLRQCLLNVDSERSRAVLHYKIGNFSMQIGRLDDAIENFSKATKIAPEFLDAYEGIIAVKLQQRDWAGVDQWLDGLSKNTQDEKLRSQLQHARSRLRDGMAHADQIQ